VVSRDSSSAAGSAERFGASPADAIAGVADTETSGSSEVDAQLTPVTAVERVQNNLVDSWELNYRIPPKQTMRKRFEIGVSIGLHNATVLPWVCRCWPLNLHTATDCDDKERQRGYSSKHSGARFQ